jgi:hypothetical protein
MIFLIHGHFDLKMSHFDSKNCLPDASGSAEMENCMGKTMKNNKLLHYVLHETQYDASNTSQRIKFQKKIPTPSMHNQSKRS